MNRTKRIKDLIEKNFNEFTVSVTDDSLAHKGHYNFDGYEETHIIIELKKKFNLDIKRLEKKLSLKIPLFSNLSKFSNIYISTVNHNACR